MITKISYWLHRISTGRMALLCLVVFLIFSALVLPTQSSGKDDQSRDLRIPDLSFYYSAEDLYQMAESYGDEGRQAYIKARFSFDIAWPAVYAAFLCTSISWVLKRTFKTESILQIGNTLPLLGVLLDFLENISTSVLMSRFPKPTPLIDVTATYFTMLKWVFVAGSFLLLIAGLSKGIVKRLGTRRSSR